MRHLTLVRHAKSSWRFDTLDDFHRPLNKRGLRDCAKMPTQLRKRVPSPERVLSSDAARAVQTCQAVADGYGIGTAAVTLDHGIYLASAGELLARLARIPASVSHLMLVGHNPGLTELCNLLLDRPIDDLPTFAVAHLAVQVDDWQELAPGCARLDQLLLPRELVKGTQA